MSLAGIAILILGSAMGQLLQLRLFGIDIPLIDLALAISLVLLAIELARQPQRPNPFTNPVSAGALIMCLVLAGSWLAAIPALAPSATAIIVSGLYCFRLVGYLLLVPLFIHTLRKSEVPTARGIILIGGAAVTLAGFVQLAIFPNFQIFDHFGWDPHQGRLIGTFLDPNYTAIWLGQAFWLAICTVAYSSRVSLSQAWSAATSLVALIATVSRTGLLALVGSTLAFTLLVSRRWTIFVVGALILVVLLVPPLRGRVSGVFELDTTVRFRLESWEGAVTLIRENPILGVGYNTLKFRRYDDALPGTSRLISRFEDGVIRETQLTSRADAGFDSSLLTIFATTGLVGIGWFLWWVWQALWRNLTRRSIASRWFAVSTAGLFLGSWFINAWLYPPILALWLISMAMAEVEQ